MIRLQPAFLLIICLAAAAFATGHDVQTQGNTNRQTTAVNREGFTLCIVAEKETVIAGEPVKIKVRLKNESTKTLMLNEYGLEQEYHLNVMREDRVEVKLTRLGQGYKDASGDINNHGALRIEPGRVFEDVLEVSAIYDMTTPETYSISVSRQVGKLDNSGQELIESNTVKVLVTNADPK
jgi:hypothetical protein